MQLAQIIGRATSTTKHPSMQGWRLLIAQMLGANGESDGADPVLVLDHLGAAKGDRVMITSDGKGLRELLNDNTSPARWWTLGIVDQCVTE